VEQELGGRGSYFSHLGDDGALASVVVNPFLVELGLRLGKPPVDRLPVDLCGPLPVRAMERGGSPWQWQFGLPQRLCRRARLPHSEVADVGELDGEVAVSALVAG